MFVTCATHIKLTCALLLCCLYRWTHKEAYEYEHRPGLNFVNAWLSMYEELQGI